MPITDLSRPRLCRLLAMVSFAPVLTVFCAIGCEDSTSSGTPIGSSAPASGGPPTSASVRGDAAAPDVDPSPPTATGAPSGSADDTGTATDPTAATETAIGTAVATATATAQATAESTAAPSATPSAVASAPPPPPPPPTLAAAKPGSADAIAAEVDDIYVPQKTFKARFKQSHRLKVQGVTKESTGTLFVEKPNKLSFRYDPPNKNRIVSDGSEIKTYIPADEQMFVQSVKNTEYPGALSFIMGNGIRPSFSFEFNAKKWAPGHTLVGTPRVPTPHYEQVFFFVDKVFLGQKSAETMKTIIIVDVQGNRNRFDFTDASHPASIPATEFSFEPPPGTHTLRK